MRYILDTNIISKREAFQRARNWIHGHQDQIALSAFTVAEMVQGIEMLPAGSKRTGLASVLNEMLDEYPVLPFGLREAQAWGAYAAGQVAKGRKIAVLDSLIAATAMAHGLWVVTENARDFPDVDQINPMIEKRAGS
jgi:predicted nucleic acid-binding protein